MSTSKLEIQVCKHTETHKLIDALTTYAHHTRTLIRTPRSHRYTYSHTLIPMHAHTYVYIRTLGNRFVILHSSLPKKVRESFWLYRNNLTCN